MPATYKVVETSEVTDTALEAILNEWTAQDWRVEAIHFAMRESSKRPAMASITFTRTEGGAAGRGALTRTPA